MQLDQFLIINVSFRIKNRFWNKKTLFQVQNQQFSIAKTLFHDKNDKLNWKCRYFDISVRSLINKYFANFPPKWKFCCFSRNLAIFIRKESFFAFDGRKNVQSWSCLRLCPVGFFFLECCAPINILKCNYLRFFSRLAVNILLWWLYIVMTKMNIKMKWSGYP